MREIKKLSELTSDLNYRLIIGNFDGLHIGHQNLLKMIKQDCVKFNDKLIVATFVPHPNVTLFNRKNFLINSYEERKKFLFQRGIDIVIEFGFDKNFSSQSPENFLKNYIMSHVRPRSIYVGYDFAFGADKKGNHHFLEQYCAPMNIEVKLLDEFKIDGQTVSSGLIRNLIQSGNILQANRFLGRPFFIKGKVKKGKGQGSAMQIPTANLDLDINRLIPANGVYSTEVKYAGNKYLGLTNVGHNPTFGENKELCIETNILDFDNNIYGETITVYFLEKMRDEKKFKSLNDLVKAVKLDREKRKSLN